MRQATLFDQMTPQNGELNADEQSGNGFRKVRRLGRIPVDWSVRRIGECIISLDAGTSVGGEDRQIRKDERGILRVSAVSSGYLRPSEHKVIPDDRLDEVDVTPKADHLIVSRANTRELVGASAYVESDHPNLFLPDKLWQIEVDERQVLPQWLHYMLWTPRLRFNIGNEATGSSGSMKNISQKRFKQLRIPVPPVEEQRQVLKYLVAWDRAIGKVDALIGKKKKRLHGLRQRLLTGEVRFPSCAGREGKQEVQFGQIPLEWDYVPIGKIASEKKVVNEDEKDITVLSCTKHEGLVDSLEYFDRQVFSDDTSNYKIVSRGDFAYATNHIEEGSIGLQDTYDRGLVSPMYTVFSVDNSKVNKYYLDEVFGTEMYRQIFERWTNGTVNRRGSLRWEEFSTIKVPVPPLSEQCKIVDALDAANSEIEKLKEKREALKRQKKGLMQRLLTGAVRTV